MTQDSLTISSAPLSSAQQKLAHVWRSDITGLRALAVIPVLLFHAFPALCPGGFLGVDIFFVISGYLISGIIFRGLINGNFSYTSFYAKRIRRIIPNLLLVLLFVFALGYLFLLAYEFRSLGKHIHSSAIFIQNIRLLKDAGDYFATASINQPLLHLWSLAIEEQFYIVFPLLASLICFIGKGSKYAIGAMVGSITLLSFIGCLLSKNPSFSFYFPLTRFWEIGAGMCLAYVETYRWVNLKAINPALRHGLSVLGLVLVVFAMGYYTTDIRTPGWYSLLPVLGACALIAAHEDSIVNRTFLSWKWVSFIGLISYSLYLWHWPILSYLHIVVLEPTNAQLVAALALSGVVSIAVYRFVENPMRTTKRFSQRAVVSFLLVGLVGAFALGQVLWKTGGLPNREFNQRFEDFGSQLLDYLEPKDLFTAKKINGHQLYVTDALKAPEILFIGDSHTNQYVTRIQKLSQESGISVAMVTAPGCLVALGNEAKNRDCKKAHATMQEALKMPSLRKVVWGQMWGNYESRYPDAQNRAMQVIDAYSRAYPDRQTVILVDQPWDESGSFDTHKHAAFNRWTTRSLDDVDFSVSLPTHNEKWVRGNEKLIAFFNQKALLIDPIEQVCPQGRCDILKCFKDDDHLRASYVKQHADWLDPIFSKN